MANNGYVHFKDMEYKPIDVAKLKKDMKKHIEDFKSAKDGKTQINIIKKVNEIQKNVETMIALCYIHFTVNTKDEYYSKENDLNDEKQPEIMGIFHEYELALNASKFKDELIDKYGELCFKKLEVSLKVFSPEIQGDLVQENKVVSRYIKLKAGAEIKYQGKIYNLSSIGKFLSDKERNVRAGAFKAVSNWYEKNCEEFDVIYDELVHIRTNIAHKLGYKNFVQLGYNRMGRIDYTPKDVENYRNQIYETVVPMCKKLYKQQQKRLQLRNMKSFDYAIKFNSGNPTPKGTPDELIAKAGKMYDAMSPETGDFFKIMRECNLLDLVAKDGKSGGGYTISIPDYKVPFIFSNFNGTSGDVDVLTHEAGHAFMYYCVTHKHPNLLCSLAWPGMEACEIHSMSMEYLTYPYMESFFKEDTNKYLFTHLVDDIEFLPYGAAIDEFQARVYENPNMKPVERRAMWREIEKKYQPHLKYSTPFFETGAKWFQQSHVFQHAFYYIDYTLAEVCAFQFFNLMNKDKDKAWKKYLKLCNMGGTKSFLDLLNDVKLKNPFEDGTIKKIMRPLSKYLKQFDDTKM